jgi:Zinc finger, C3HC4 type (RING finger)
MDELTGVHLNDFTLDKEPIKASDTLGRLEPGLCLNCGKAPARIAALGCGHLYLCHACAVVARETYNRCAVCGEGLLDADGRFQLQALL